MKAVIITKYGPPEVLQIKEIEKPVPKENQVLIKIHATTAHAGDSRVRRSDPFLVVRLLYGLFKPKKNLIPGVEISGVVEAVGKNVTLFKPKDIVHGLTGFGLKGYAEYCCLPEKVKDGAQERKGYITVIPKNMSLPEAAVIPSAGLTVLKNFQKAKIKAGDEILINGGSGSLGTNAIQLAKHFGAIVTVVCSTKNLDLVKSLGADKVIDYTQEDFTRTDKRYDIVYDAVMKSTRGKCKKILKKGGVFLNNYWLSSIKEADISLLNNLIEDAKIKPIIDRTYPLSDIVNAHKYLDTERKKGNVIIMVENEI